MITIPTLQELYLAIITDLEGGFDIDIPEDDKNFLRALAAVQAGKLKLNYLALGKLQKNIFVDTADSEESGGTLQRFGRVKLGRNPFPATQGEYEVTVTGTIGSTVDGQTTFKSNDDSQSPGKLFILDESYTLVSASDTITLRALEAGLTSQIRIADKLTATAPIIGVNAGVIVSAVATIPQSAEDIEDYRAKSVESYRLESQGGAPADYRLWGLDAQGVKQIYPYAKSGAPNEINVYVEATIADSTDGKGTPTTAIMNEVDAVIELDPDTTLPIEERGRRPLGVFDVHVLPVTILNVNITIAGFEDLTATKQTLISDALREALADVRPFIAGADILSDKNDTLSRNTIISVILNTIPGATFTTVIMNVNGVDEISHVFDNGTIPYLNFITYA